MKNSIWIIGGGYMAKEYAKVLDAQNKEFIIIDKTNKEAEFFKKRYGVNLLSGGLEKILKTDIRIKTAIIATSINMLSRCCIALLKHGTNNILLEKPGALTIKDLKRIKTISEKKNANVHIAYNRRFYQSVIKLKNHINKNEEITSCFVDFTERSVSISKSKLSKETKEKMIYSNSSHMFDLFFYLCGHPKKLSTYNKGKIEWHPNASIFSGSGLTINNILFSYFADWGSAGRWKIDIRTNKKNFILQPIEELKVMHKDSFEIYDININSELDKAFKPGIYIQTKLFLQKKFDNFCNIDYQIESFKYLKKIGNYNE